MLFRPIINASTILKHNSILHQIYIEHYARDIDFKDVLATLSQGKKVEELDYHVKDRLLYHCGKLCIPQTERVKIIREAHTSLISGHFGVSKTVAQLQRFCYCPISIHFALLGFEPLSPILRYSTSPLHVILTFLSNTVSSFNSLRYSGSRSSIEGN